MRDIVPICFGNWTIKDDCEVCRWSSQCEQSRSELENDLEDWDDFDDDETEVKPPDGRTDAETLGTGERAH